MNNNFEKITDEKDEIYKNINNIANSQLKTYITSSNIENINLNYKTIIVNNKDSTITNPTNIKIPRASYNQINVIYTIITKYLPSGIVEGISLPVIITLQNNTDSKEIILNTDINTVKIIYINDSWKNLNDYNNDIDNSDIVNFIYENSVIDLNYINTIIDNSSEDIILTLPETGFNIYQSNKVYNIQILYSTGCEVIIKSDKNGYINLNSNNNNVSLLFDKENTKKWIIVNNNLSSFYTCINSVNNNYSEVGNDISLPNNKQFQLISSIDSYQKNMVILYDNKIHFYTKDFNTQKWVSKCDSIEKPDNTFFTYNGISSSSISLSSDGNIFCLCCYQNKNNKDVRTLYVYKYDAQDITYDLITITGNTDPFIDNDSIFGQKILIDINNKIYVNKVKNINPDNNGLYDNINFSYFYIYKINNNNIELETTIKSSELLLKNNPIDNYIIDNSKSIVLGYNFEVSSSGNSILLICPYYNINNVYDKTYVLSIQKIEDSEALSPYVIESYFNYTNNHFGDIMLLKNDDTLICNSLNTKNNNTDQNGTKYSFIMEVFIFKKYNKNWEQETVIKDINFSFYDVPNKNFDINKILFPLIDISGDCNVLSILTSSLINTNMSPYFDIYKREGLLWINKKIISNPIVNNDDTYFISSTFYMNNQGKNLICLYADKKVNNEYKVSIVEIY